VRLTVLDFNERAQRCYASVGFVEVARIPSGVVDGTRPAEDVVKAIDRDASSGPGTSPRSRPK